MEITFSDLEKKIRALVKEHGLPKYYRWYINPFHKHLQLDNLRHLLQTHIETFTDRPLNFYWHEPDSDTPSPEMELDSAVRGVPIRTDSFCVKILYKDGTYDAYNEIINDDDLP